LKLAEHDSVKLTTVLDDVYRGGQPDPQDITKFEWQVILAYMGASDAEIADVRSSGWGGCGDEAGPGLRTYFFSTS
jgi:hypothetical protein